VGTKRRFTTEFRRLAVARMKVCDSVADLARELGIPRQTLYVWRDQEESKTSPEAGRSSEDLIRVEEENRRLKRLLAEKTLETDFFRGALQKIETRRQKSGSGARASTTRSGK